MQIEKAVKFKPADLILIILPLVIAAAVAFAVFKPADNPVAVITVNGCEVKRIELNNADNGTVDLNIPLKYNNIIEIKNKKIGVVSAGCKDNTCVHTGFIGNGGQISVCVPSGLIIEIVNGGADAVSR